MPQIETEKLEQYAQQVFDRLNYFNDYVLQTIGRRIKKTGELSAHDQQALKNMADISGDMDRITKELAKITEQNIYDVEQLYTQVMTDSVNTYRPLYDYKKITFIPFSENEFAQQLVRNWTVQTAGEMINLSRTKALCFDQYDARGTVVGSTPLQGAFQKAIDDAVIAVSSGTVDFHTAMRETVKNLGGSGVKVHYGSGVNRSLSAMVRQNLLYGAKQSAQAYDEHAGKELGCNGFEVDAHAGCRPSHMFMQGQMYSYRGTVRIGGKTYIDGTEALERLKDYNCLHFKIDVILGVSQPRYSKAELDRIQRETTDMIEYNGQKKTLYEWKQTQRKMERVVRNETAVRDMAAASGDRTLVKDCNAKIGAYRAKYDELCGQVKGLEPRLDRMASYGQKSLTDRGENGMITIEGDMMFRKAKGQDYIEPMPKKQLLRIERAFKKRGGMIQRDKETDNYLVKRNAEGITINANTILLKQKAGRASVFEELIHSTQYKNGKNNGSYYSRLQCEIEAQEKLLKYAKAYRLSENEIRQTEDALEHYKKELEAYLKNMEVR